MKLTVLIKNDRAQLVLSPEDAFERNALTAFHEATPDGMIIRKGSFYECRAGYTRESASDGDFILVAIRKQP